MKQNFSKAAILMSLSSIACIVSDLLSKSIKITSFKLLFYRFWISIFLLLPIYFVISHQQTKEEKFLYLNNLILFSLLIVNLNSTTFFYQLHTLLFLILNKKERENFYAELALHVGISIACIIMITQSYIHIGSLICGIASSLLNHKKKNADPLLTFDNFIRALLLTLGMISFTIGLRKLPLAIVILLNFCTPILTTIFSKLILNESLKHKLWVCIFNTTGIFIAVLPNLHTNAYQNILHIIIASVFFSLTDIFNKWNLKKNENIVEIIIGSSIFSTILLFLIITFSHEPILIKQTQIFPMIAVAASAIFIPLFLIEASKYADLSSLQPIKYIEFPLGVISSYYFFKDSYTAHIFLGFAIIAIGTTFNHLQETKKIIK